MPPILLNLGCGTRIHTAWQNYDLVAMVPGVRAIDLRGRLPFPDASADAVYHSHVLEHLERTHAAAFLSECRRVLKPGGTLRIAVPDLEGICRRYLRELDAAAAGEPGAIERHGWMTIELLDQCVRTVPGGEMLKWWCAAKVPAEELVRERMGNEFGRYRQWFDTEVARAGARPAWADSPVPSVGVEAEAAFRRQGEIHRWMYDRVALSALLTRVGFDAASVRVVGAQQSAIEGWAGFELDADAAGNAHKPDSLFMEAIR